MPYKNRSKIFKDKYFKLNNDKVSKNQSDIHEI